MELKMIILNDCLKYKHPENIISSGLLSLNEVQRMYKRTDCLLFPSKLEFWRLPISEFGTYNKPILAADLPYAYETASNCESVCFFNPVKAEDLANRMEEVIRKDFSHFEKCRPANILLSGRR
ncbi:MAG: glycosyltransferase [Odoribacter sp.]